MVDEIFDLFSSGDAGGGNGDKGIFSKAGNWIKNLFTSNAAVKTGEAMSTAGEIAIDMADSARTPKKSKQILIIGVALAAGGFLIYKWHQRKQAQQQAIQPVASNANFPL